MAAPNPFVGPRPFKVDEPHFFGRDREIRELHLRLNADRIVLLHSPSGAGKTSLVQAGLLPLLARTFTFDVWRPTRVNAEPAVPGVNRYTLSALQGFEEEVPENLRRPVEVLAGQTLSGYFEKRPRRRSAPQNVLLVFDQFEEILTIDPLAVDAKHEFFGQLGELLRNPRVWALFALREDYLAPLDPYAPQVPTHLKNRFRIDLLGLEAAREAIVGPARDSGRKFPAVDELVADLATMKVQQPDGTFMDEPGQHVEPVQLQVVCRRLWDAMPEGDLSIGHEDLERFGDVTEALATYYADSVGRIAAGDPGRERAVRDWFGEALITAGGIRGQVLREAKASGGLANDLIDQLRGTHLVRAEKRAGATWYELAHDRLIEPVQSDNASWREKHLADVQRRAALWEQQDRPTGLLLAGEELAKGERWAAVNGARVTDIEGKFLAESRKAYEISERERRQARRIRWLAVGASIVGMLALGAFIFATWQWRQNKQALARAYLNEARRLSEDGEGRKALAYHALFLRRDPDNSAARGWSSALLFRTSGLIPSNPLRHDGPVVSASFSPDGQRVVTASLDGTARVWEADTGQAAGKPLRHAFWVTSASFSPDGLRVVTASANGTARVWEAATRQPVGEPMRHGDVIYSASFSPDGLWLVTASADGTARVWEAATRQPVGEPMRHDDAIYSASFSPDGLWVVTASADGTARVWEAATRQPVGEPMRHDDAIYSASFSPDGLWVVTASADGTARVWEAATRRPVTQPMRHDGPVLAATFRPGSVRVVTGSMDAAREWDVATGQPVGEPMRHGRAVNRASYSSDGLRVVTASADGTARVWDVAPDQPCEPLPHPGRVVFASFSPDGRQVVTVSLDNAARVWNAANGQPIGSPLRLEGKARSVAFSPDGPRVVTASDDTAQVWNAATGQKVGKPLPHSHFSRATFSPDGLRVVTVSSDGTAQVWNAANGQKLGVPLRHEGSVIFAAFNADGKRVVTGSRDKTVRVWEVATGRPIGKPMHHDGAVNSAAISPDGERVVTGSDDWTAQVWEVATGRRVGEPMRHDGPVRSVTFTPHPGRRVLTASEDGTARVWEAATGMPMGEPFHHGGPVNSASFSPDGLRILTASDDHTARIWDVLFGKVGDSEELAELAEVVGGYRVTDLGELQAIPPAERAERLARLRRMGEQAPANQPTVASFIRWYFTPRFKRSVSLLSTMTVEEYIRRLLALGTKEARREAMEAFPGHPLLTAPPPTPEIGHERVQTR